MATALLALLKAKTPASNRVQAANSSDKSDYRVLDGPINGMCFVLTEGEFSRERTEFGGGRSTSWIIECQIFALFSGDTETHDLVVGASQDIISTVDAWPKLNGTSGVFETDVDGGDKPQQLFERGGAGPHWLMRTIRVLVIEDIEVSVQE